MANAAREHRDHAGDAVREPEVPVAGRRDLALPRRQPLRRRMPREAAAAWSRGALELVEHATGERLPRFAALERVDAEPGEPTDQIVVATPPIEAAQQRRVDRRAHVIGGLTARE